MSTTTNTKDSSSTEERLAQLDEYRLLGASGLRVSPLCLGTMTFGSNWQIGEGFEESKKVFDYYVEKGGNFVDTANIYTEGTSEQYVGELVAPIRSQMVVATKYSINPPSFFGAPASSNAKNANYGGNHRKAMVQGLDESLKRMKLDYVDVLYVHAWDFRTPVEETMRALDDVVRSGKALYVAVSDTPAWVIATANNTAKLRGWSPYIGLQTRYNLLERSLEYELGPMALANDIGIIPWGAVAEGFLTGKHKKDQTTNPGKRGSFVERHYAEERNWKILDEVIAVADEAKRSPVQVALNWLSQKPGVTSPLVGARTVDQLKENIAALDFKLTPQQMARLDQVSDRPPSEQPFPRNFIAGAVDFTVGATKVERRYAH
jgi:aryl-alcohol dehydrogenase-like predicted oxidoreductase